MPGVYSIDNTSCQDPGNIMVAKNVIKGKGKKNHKVFDIQVKKFALYFMIKC